MASQNEKILSLALLSLLNHVTGKKLLTEKDLESFSIEASKILAEDTDQASVKDKAKVEQNRYIHLAWMDEKTCKREDLHSKAQGIVDIACFRGDESLCVLYLTDDLKTILQPITDDNGQLMGFCPCGQWAEVKVLSQWIKREVDQWQDEGKSWRKHYIALNQSAKFAPVPIPDREEAFYLPDGSIYQKPEAE